MTNDWLEITNPDLNQAEIAQKIESRLQSRAISIGEATAQPSEILDALWSQIIGRERIDAGTTNDPGVTLRDCDIVPRTYTIGWQNPLLGPIYAFIRRTINGEVRRFLAPSLEQQSALNRQLLRLIQDLKEDNNNLRQEIALLKKDEE